MPFRILQSIAKSSGKKCSGKCPDCPNRKKRDEAKAACEEEQRTVLVRAEASEEARVFTGRREEFAI